MYDAQRVAKVVEFYLRDDATTLRAKPPASPAEDRNIAGLIRVAETATVQVTGENEVTGRVIDNADGQAWSVTMKIAMEKAAAETAPEAEIIQNTPVEWLLAW